jgi:hypothetical protein
LIVRRAISQVSVAIGIGRLRIREVRTEEDVEAPVARQASLVLDNPPPVVPAIDIEEWGPKIEAFTGARAERVVAREKAGSAGYLAKAAAEPGAARSDSGLIYRDLSHGNWRLFGSECHAN